MIIALPGETADSWLYSLNKDYELGIDFMLPIFKFSTKHRAVYR